MQLSNKDLSQRFDTSSGDFALYNNPKNIHVPAQKSTRTFTYCYMYHSILLTSTECMYIDNSCLPILTIVSLTFVLMSFNY